MKKLSTPLLTILLVLATFSLVLYSSCTDMCKDVICQNGGICQDGACKCINGFTGLNCEIPPDSCKNIICMNGGICVSGKCDCKPGYEGINCETVTRERYVGGWTVFENGTATNPQQYEVSVQNGTAMNEINVLNFYNKFATPVVVRITGDSLFIPEQVVEQHQVGGWGILEPGDKTIRLRYKIIDKYGNIDDFGRVNGEPSIWSK